MIRTDPGQPNLVDGSVYAYEIVPGGAYVTVAGNGTTPLILSFDADDIASLRAVVDSFTARSA
jgi:hypothetical protein